MGTPETKGVCWSILPATWQGVLALRVPQLGYYCNTVRFQNTSPP